MPEDIRGAFRRLGIDRPEKSFVSYPLAQVLFHKMEPVQRQALHTLVGKGLVATQELREGRASLSELGREMYVRELAACSGSERMLVTFLASQFGTVGEDQPGGLYRNTGLRRRG